MTEQLSSERISELLAQYRPAECDASCEDPFCHYTHGPEYPAPSPRETYALLREVASSRSFATAMSEALNSGDGTYRP
jgi:hypothetical protein